MSAVAAWKDASGYADRQVKTRAYGMGCCVSSFVSSLRQGSRHDEHQKGGGGSEIVRHALPQPPSLPSPHPCFFCASFQHAQHADMRMKEFSPA